MREFELRRGHFKGIGGSAGIRASMQEVFGNVKDLKDSFESNYGAMKTIRVKVLSPDKIAVETETDAKVAADVAADTMKKYSEFMARATGFNSKERAKRAQQSAKKGKP
jgi:hypothetical protein